MKMNLVILLPLGKVIGSQILSLSLIFFPLKNHCFASVSGMKSVITLLKTVSDLQLFFLPYGKHSLELITIVLPVWLSRILSASKGIDVAVQRCPL